MNITLSNLKISNSLSEETTAFTAIICVDGAKVADVKNHGQGGCNHYTVYKGQEGLYKKVEAYVKGLPAVKSDEEGLPDLAMDLDLYIDDLMCATEFNKKILKLEKQNIIIVNGNKTGEARSIKLSNPIADILTSLNGKERMRKIIEQVKPLLKKGDRIANNNIPKEFKPAVK